MFYLLCFREKEFACKEYVEQNFAMEQAEWLIQHDFYDRVVLTESIAECFFDEEDYSCPDK